LVIVWTQQVQGSHSDLVVSKADPTVGERISIAITSPIFATALDQAEAGGKPNVLQDCVSIHLYSIGDRQSG
jgi:hypothetical protein